LSLKLHADQAVLHLHLQKFTAKPKCFQKNVQYINNPPAQKKQRKEGKEKKANYIHPARNNDPIARLKIQSTNL